MLHCAGGGVAAIYIVTNALTAPKLYLLQNPRARLDPEAVVPRARYQVPNGHFTPVLRFILADKTQRIFRVERVSYFDDDWIRVGAIGPVDQLASQLIPKLVTDALFEAY